jgi:HEAT repeat protein
VAWVQRGAIVVWLASTCVAARGQADAAELRATGVASSATDSAQASASTPASVAYTQAKLALGSTKAQERIAAAHDLDKLGQARRAETGGLLRPLVLTDPDAGVRAAAARTLGRLGIRDAVPELIEALADPAPEVRTVAAAAIWRLPDERATDSLVKLLADAAPAPREWAALALGVIGSVRAVPALSDRVRDPERAVRLAVLRSLGRIGDAAGVAAVGVFLETAKTDGEEFEECIGALAGMRSSESAAVLAALLRRVETDEGRALLVLNALGEVGGQGMVATLARTAAKARSPRVRTAAAAAVARAHDRVAREGPAPAVRP